MIRGNYGYAMNQPIIAEPENRPMWGPVPRGVRTPFGAVSNPNVRFGRNTAPEGDADVQGHNYFRRSVAPILNENDAQNENKENKDPDEEVDEYEMMSDGDWEDYDPADYVIVRRDPDPNDQEALIFEWLRTHGRIPSGAILQRGHDYTRYYPREWNQNFPPELDPQRNEEDDDDEEYEEIDARSNNGDWNLMDYDSAEEYEDEEYEDEELEDEERENEECEVKEREDEEREDEEREDEEYDDDSDYVFEEDEEYDENEE